MIFLTVILNFLAITTAIRVPSAWPKQEKQIPDLKVEQDAYLSDVAGENFKIISDQLTKAYTNQISNKSHTPKLERQAADVAYVAHFVQPMRRQSGSHAEFVTSNNNKPQQSKEKQNVRKPDVSYFIHHSNNARSPTVLHANAVKQNNKQQGYYNQNINHDEATTKKQLNNAKKISFLQPLVYVNRNANFPTSVDGWMPITGQHSPHKIQESNHVYAYRNLDRKHNQTPDRSTNRRQPALNRRRQYKNANDREDSQSASNYQHISQHYPASRRNYRDDKTHEVSNSGKNAETEDENDEVVSENDDFKEDVTEKVPVSEHEIPKDVPTKPNYPGEGQWAIRGLEHQPFVSHHSFAQLSDDSDEKPEGFETFQNADTLFKKQYSTFAENLQSFPQKHRLGEYIDSKSEETEDEDHEEQNDAEEETSEDDEEEDSFVPTRTLAQVRKTENEEYLPSSIDDVRLREVIKDSKIHTVYTEEGYEDIAYDHAGHEKNAEDSEGHAEFNKNAVTLKQKPQSRTKSKSDEVNVLKEFENYEEPAVNDNEHSDAEATFDTEVSASSYENPNLNKNMKINQFTKTKESKTTKIKNMEDGDIEMEITSEVKVVTQPNNVSTAHKFVKIVPKNKNKFTVSDDKPPTTNYNSLKILKRHKRFVNDFPKIDVDKDFLDVLTTDKQRVLPVVTTEKYPYYNIKDTNTLNKNSPLRYAEDMKNIPKKIPGRMSFYEKSEISECPEIPRNVDPIPDRVKQAQNNPEEKEENGESGGLVELPDVPRLRNLGDKIDCLKLKLFGENPLDSPIFQETVVAPPESIFKDFDSINTIAKTGHEEDSSQSEKVLNDAVAISHSLTAQDARKFYNRYDEEKQRNKHVAEEQLGELYSASGLNEEHEENDGDYQEVINKTPVQSSEAATSSTVLNNNYQTTKESFADTTPGKFSQTTKIANVSNISEYDFQTTKKPTVDIITPETETLPPHFEAKINFIPNHTYHQVDFSLNVDLVDATSSALPVTEAYTQGTMPSINNAMNKENAVTSENSDQILQTTEEVTSRTAVSNNTARTFIPKNIYDQIDLLNNPTTIATKNNLNVTVSDVEGQKLNLAGNPIVNKEKQVKTTNNRQPKAFNVDVAPNFSNNSAKTVLNLTDWQFVTTKRMDVGETLPESAALRIQKRRRKLPQRLLLHVFDVNRFLPTPLPPLPTYPTTSTVLPKYKTLSEVYYKDDIKPNEQLNVFADVINNIKNAPPEILHAEGSENFAMVEGTWNVSEPQKDTGKKLKIPPRKVRIKHSDSSKIFPNLNNDVYITSTTISTTTLPSRRRRKNKYKNHQPETQLYEEYFEAVKLNGRDPQLPQRTSTVNMYKTNKPLTTNRPEDSYISEDTSYYNPVLSQDLTSGAVVDDVLELAPPYSTKFPVVHPSVNIKNPYSVYSLTESSTLNTFPVSGMKPPSNRKPLSYSDYRLVQHNRIRRKNNHRIHKRSPYKPSYSEIRRNKPAQVSDEEEEEKGKDEEEDYVPQRNRNFHYDVENDRVVYNHKKEDEDDALPEREEKEDEQEQEDVEYVTLKSDPPKPKFIVVTTESNGPSFLEYLQQLKNNSNYRVILDPQPTKKSGDEKTTKADLKQVESTTTKQVEAVPEFLSIISKLKSNDDYKEIKDKRADHAATVSPKSEDEVEAEETEEPNIDVRNSPGASQTSTGYDRPQIFDISEYLPQPKNYSPKTVIDYSKYKTIQRAPVATRHNFSSRYNSENGTLPVHNQSVAEAPNLAAFEDSAKASSSEQLLEQNTNIDGGTRRSGYSSSEETVEEGIISLTTTKTPEITTIRPRIRMRGRKRPTTTTPKPITTTSTPSSTRRQRLRSRPTTTTESTLEENYSHTQRVVHRRRPIERYSRQNRKVPDNHKEFYTPIVIEEEADIDSKPSIILRKRKVSGLVTTHRMQLSTNATSPHQGELEKPEEIQPQKLAEVQVFRKYDPHQKHGGNYRREHEDSSSQTEVNSGPPTAYEIENSREIKRLSDVVPKPFAFYSDPTLPGSVNQLKEQKATEDLLNESEESELLSNSQEKTSKDFNEDYEDEVRINFNKSSETATKKPVYIVKDPSKRLYYYAPVK